MGAHRALAWMASCVHGLPLVEDRAPFFPSCFALIGALDRDAQHPLCDASWSRAGRHGILGRDTSTERDVLSSASERVKKVGEGGDVWDVPTLTCHMEDEPMIYEVRTYTLRPGTVAEFEDRFAKRLPLRE